MKQQLFLISSSNIFSQPENFEYVATPEVNGISSQNLLMLLMETLRWWSVLCPHRARLSLYRSSRLIKSFYILKKIKRPPCQLMICSLPFNFVFWWVKFTVCWDESPQEGHRHMNLQPWCAAQWSCRCRIFGPAGFTHTSICEAPPSCQPEPFLINTLGLPAEFGAPPVQNNGALHQ